MAQWVDPSDVPARLASGQGEAQYTGIPNAAGVTYTVPQMLSGFIDRSGAAVVSDTTPTAAALAAGMIGYGANDMKMVIIRNRNSGILTVLAGAGVLLDGANTVANGASRTYGIRVNSRTPGAESVTLVAMN